MPSNPPINPSRLPAQVDSLPAIGALREIADRVPAHVVGGTVRDLLLGIEGADVDVAVDGDIESLLDLPGFELEREGLFLTGRLERDGVRVDVARTRAESYPHPGALPEVRPASIEEDLARRDFTVNAMALPLSGERELLDPSGGLADLRTGLLRVLYYRSFSDDPTRALRAARYASRFGFELEAETARLLRRADMSTVSDDRVQNELRRALAEPDPAAALRLIVDWGILTSLDPAAPDRVTEVLRLASTPPWLGWVDPELAAQIAIVRPLPQVRELAAATPERASEAVRLAGPWDPAQLLVARARGAEWLDRYAADWRHVGLEITGEDLLDAGIPEGPAIGTGLEAALSGKLDGELSGRAEELRIALAAARGDIPE